MELYRLYFVRWRKASIKEEIKGKKTFQLGEFFFFFRTIGKVGRGDPQALYIARGWHFCTWLES